MSNIMYCIGNDCEKQVVQTVSQEGNDKILHANLSMTDTWDNLMVAFCIVGLRIDYADRLHV